MMTLCSEQYNIVGLNSVSEAPSVRRPEVPGEQRIIPSSQVSWNNMILTCTRIIGKNLVNTLGVRRFFMGEGPMKDFKTHYSLYYDDVTYGNTN